jgi:hypothetical protein
MRPVNKPKRSGEGRERIGDYGKKKREPTIGEKTRVLAKTLERVERTRVEKSLMRRI